VTQLTHPYSIYIWRPSRYGGSWYELYQAFTQEDAIYIANLIYHDAKCVMKVVRYGIPFACFPDEKSVKLVEQQIAREKQRGL
jgi:hypothetical protein